MPRRRAAARGGLTEEDRAVWRAYATRVTPLPGREAGTADDDGTPPRPSPAEGGGGNPGRAAAPPPPRGGGGPGRGPAPSPPRLPAPLQVGVPPGGLDARRWRDLRRGRTRPERTLDLHGRRAAEAHEALRAFLAGAQADGLRCVAVVTGKGSSPEGGVLRRELPHWLNASELRLLVLGAAHPHAANPGAVHLLLRRRKTPPSAPR